MNKVLITGATGYLAGRIAYSLHKDFDITLGSRNLAMLKNVEVFQGFSLTALDMANESSFATALKNIDIVIHLAAMNHQDCEKNPELARHINVTQTQKLINAALANQVKKFLYLSTIHVYGTPFPEAMCETSPTHPQSVYAKTHLEAEGILRQAHATGKIQALILRLANALGAPMHQQVPAWGLVANDLCLQAVKHRKMVLKSIGNQERNFVSISYLGRAINSLFKATFPDEDSDPIFNVGGQINLTIWQLAQKIQERCQILFGYRPDLTRPSAERQDQNNQNHFEFDCRKLQKIAGEEALDELDQEIDQTLKFCKGIEL
jgi:UDP-glucose 4-epimerase